MTEPKTLSGCLERAAGTNVAVGVHFAGRARSDIDGDTFHSYADIYARALDVASGLRALGIGKAEGDRVAVAVPTSIEFYDAFFGAVLAGAVPVSLPLPRRFGPVDDSPGALASHYDPTGLYTADGTCLGFRNPAGRCEDAPCCGCCS